MSKSSSEKKLAGAGRVVAVAVENNKTSQYAAKWAVDNLLPKDQYVLLIHVLQRNPTHIAPYGMNPEDEAALAYQHADNETKALFDSFRIFFTRKSIRVKEIVLEDPDISKALIQSIHTFSIELLVLGVARSYLVRFRTVDVPTTVSKGAPPFCNVYVISKGKVANLKPATTSLTPKPSPSPSTRWQSQSLQIHERRDPLSRNHPPRPAHAPLPPATPAYGSRRFQDDDDDFRSPFNRNGRPNYMSGGDSDISFVSSGKPTVDRLFSSFEDEMDTTGIMSPWDSFSSDSDARSSCSGRRSLEMTSPFGDYSFNSENSGKSASKLTDSMEDMDSEVRKLKLELKQTMDMYSSACKEALTAKQKATDLQRWKMEEEMKIEEAKTSEEAALILAEKEKEKRVAALMAKETSEKIAEFEAQKRMSAEGPKRNPADSFGLVTARCRRYSIEEIEAATQRFSDSVKIGEGGYGPVYKGELDHTAVAIKVLKSDAAQGRAQFLQEVEVLSCIRHPNMVLLLGACPEYGCLVYEYMANGSLDDCLFRRGRGQGLPWQLRFQIAAEIATGLLFLHQTKPEPLVHRDLKPGNILLDRNFVSKISDVGLARLVPPTVANSVTQYRMTSTAGTFCYIDPEYQQTGMLGIKSDIYSFGIMLLQIITAKSPMGIAHHVARSIEKGTFAEMLDPAVEDWPMEHALHFARISLQCAEMRRKDRPSLGKVVLPELNKLRDFAEDNMPMMMMFRRGAAGFGNPNPRSNLSCPTSSNSLPGPESQ